MELIIALVILFVLFVLSALPLHLAVKIMGGDTSLIKTFLVMILSGAVVSAIQGFFGALGSIIAFIVLLWIYKAIFDLGWLRAFAAWLLQFVFVVAIYVFLFAALGLGSIMALL